MAVVAASTARAADCAASTVSSCRKDTSTRGSA